MCSRIQFSCESLFIAPHEVNSFMLLAKSAETRKKRTVNQQRVQHLAVQLLLCWNFRKQRRKKSFVCISTSSIVDNNEIEFFHLGNMELISKHFACLPAPAPRGAGTIMLSSKQRRRPIYSHSPPFAWKVVAVGQTPRPNCAWCCWLLLVDPAALPAADGPRNLAPLPNML